ncbi:uncharacterized protein [Aegilops tauschii subsp. strangulata]
MSLTHVATLHIENMGLSYLELPPEEKHIKIPVMVATLGIKAKVRLKMFRGKSGAVVLRVVGEGLFLFNLSDRSMRRIDSVVTKKYFLCPYDIDWLSCLAITNLVVDGSLSLDPSAISLLPISCTSFPPLLVGEQARGRGMDGGKDKGAGGYSGYPGGYPAPAGYPGYPVPVSTYPPAPGYAAPPGQYAPPPGAYPQPGGYQPPHVAYPPSGYPATAGYPQYPTTHPPAGYPAQGQPMQVPPYGHAPMYGGGGHGVAGGMVAGGAAAAAAAYGAHKMSHGGAHGMYGHGHHQGKFKHGKFKHGKFGKHKKMYGRKWK